MQEKYRYLILLLCKEFIQNLDMYFRYMASFLGIDWSVLESYVYNPNEDFVYPDFGNFSYTIPDCKTARFVFNLGVYYEPKLYDDFRGNIIICF